MSASGALSNRVHDILRRMADNLTQAEATKTCYGILAIMSREDASKTIIAKQGLETILSGMQTHMDKADVQEAGCDLIWSLAFNNAEIKELIGKCNGTAVVVRSLKRHSKSPEFLKSACGALSNLCQFKVNQQGVASHGGLQPLISAIAVHQRNSKLLPFIFDALASLIVGNEENARVVSSQDGITKILTATVLHKDVSEVVKSGCHALAILSDVKGQASKIAFSGGVAAILPLLDLHPSYPDFHRVAAVVLLRMLQESSHVVREIATNNGIRILLKSLDKGGAQQDTVAAITHILSTVTNPLAATTNSIENQLWISAANGGNESDNDSSSVSGTHPRKSRFARNDSRYVVATDVGLDSNGPVRPPQPLGRKQTKDVSALLGLVKLMGQYTERKDVARASCRLLNNLIGYAGVIMALDNVGLMDKVLECVYAHRNTKDILESASSLIKAIHKRTFPAFAGNKISSIRGLMHLVRCKMHDDEVVVAALEILQKLVEKDPKSQAKVSGSPVSQEVWGEEAVSLCSSIIENIVKSCPKIGPGGADGSTLPWTKSTPKLLSTLLEFLECASSRRTAEERFCYPISLSTNIENISALIPSRHAEIADRMQRLLPHIQPDVIASTSLKSSQSVESISPNDFDSSDNKPKNSNTTQREKLKTSLNRKKKPEALTPTLSPKKATREEVGDDDNNIDSNDKSSTDSSTLCLQGNEAAQCDEDDSFQPKHPLKFFSQLPESQRSLSIPTLLSNAPNYLEALASEFAMSSGAFDGDDGSGDDCKMPGVRGAMYQQPLEAALPSRMHLCYQSSNPAGRDLVSKCPNPVPYDIPSNGLGKPFLHTLTFDSEFESGNLYRAVQRGEREYDLCLRCDIHTPGHTQWFYFAVSNTYSPDMLAAYDSGQPVAHPKYRFNITNLTKPDSLFNQGMRPVVYSCRDAKNKGAGWVRAGSNISYYSNPFPRNNMAGEGVASYFSLSFTLELANPRDTYLIAYSYPYTYTDNKAHIQQLLKKPGAKDFIRHSVLCNTLSGADCDLLVITNFKDKENLGPIHNTQYGKNGNDSNEQSKAARKKAKLNRKALVISARVHPGETPASWMMKGALDFLTGNSPNAKLLRQAYVIYVVPMLNPDGVIFGNNRCGLAGVDLNRQWKNPVKALHPTVYALKSLLQEQKTFRDISMYIDLHGHSRKYNIFMYGCEEKKRPNPKVRAFPKFFSLHNLGKKYVSYTDCSFHVRKGREATARVVVARDIGITNSYTVEATFCGADSGPLKYCHMNMGHLEEVGVALLDSFIQYSIAEGDVPDAVIVSSRKNSAVGKGEATKSSKSKSKKSSVKSALLVPLGASDEACGSDGDDVQSDDDASCSQSVLASVSEGSGSGSGPRGYAIEKIVGGAGCPLRGVRTAGAAGSRSQGVAMLSATGGRSRSETAPANGPVGSFGSDRPARVLALDDSFGFADSNSIRAVSGAPSSTYTCDAPDRSLFKESTVSIRPKKASRKGGFKSKKEKSTSKMAKQMNAVTSSDSFINSSSDYASNENIESLHEIDQQAFSSSDKDDISQYSVLTKPKHALLGSQQIRLDASVNSVAFPKVNTR